jgi:broad specificity phosphatase PhoE
MHASIGQPAESHTASLCTTERRVKAPGIVRRRAPFLTPFWVAGLMALALLLAVYLAGRLSAVGVARAERLAALLAAAPLAAVYASDTRRAQQTAAPLAARHRLPVTVRSAKDVRGLIDDIGARHVGRTVVVVGHSNTVPEIVSALTRGKQTVSIADDQFDRIFIVTVTRFGPPSTTELRY